MRSRTSLCIYADLSDAVSALAFSSTDASGSIGFLFSFCLSTTCAPEAFSTFCLSIGCTFRLWLLGFRSSGSFHCSKTRGLEHILNRTLYRHHLRMRLCSQFRLPCAYSLRSHLCLLFRLRRILPLHLRRPHPCLPCACVWTLL